MATANYTMSEADIKAGKTTPLTPGALGTASNPGTSNLVNYNMGNVITSDAMKPVNPVPLANASVDPNSYTSSIGTVAADLANGERYIMKKVLQTCTINFPI
jgi:hypothetical protein